MAVLIQRLVYMVWKVQNPALQQRLATLAARGPTGAAYEMPRRNHYLGRGVRAGLFWPDRKGIALRQVQAILAKQDATATDPATLKTKSVAVQGLGALEYVLFGTGAEALALPEGDFRCDYGNAITSAVSDVAAPSGSLPAG